MRLQRTAFAAVLIALVVPTAVAATQTSNPASKAPQPQVRRPQGFLDYTLGKINPENVDYGAQLQAARDSAVDHTVDDLYFWSNMFTLLLLGTATALLLLQQRAANKKEIIVATLITELWNGRVSDRIEIARRTQQYNELVDLHNAEVERGLIARSDLKTSEEKADAKVQRTVNKLAERPPRTGSATKGHSPSDGEMEEANSPNGDKGQIALQQRILLQQGQLEAMRNTEQNLKERLNQTTSLLEQERKRNQTLKGA